MKYLNPTIVLASVAALALAAPASAQSTEGSGSVKRGQKAGANIESGAALGSGDLWWNNPNAMEDAKSRFGDMVTGLDKTNAGAGAGSGESGASKEPSMTKDDLQTPDASKSAPRK